MLRFVLSFGWSLIDCDFIIIIDGSVFLSLGLGEEIKMLNGHFMVRREIESKAFCCLFGIFYLNLEHIL